MGGQNDVNLLARLRSVTPALVPSMQRVASVILADPQAAAALTIGELAEHAQTSQTTVLRLCREVGLSGYRDLRMALAAEGGRAEGRGQAVDLGSDIGRTDSLDDIITKITATDAQAVSETAPLLDRQSLAAVVDAIAAAGRVDVFGVGASAFVAMDLQQKLHRIGVTCFCWTDEHAALTATALLRPGDVAIGVSHTGATRDTVETVRHAGARGATTVALTSAPRSPLAKAVDYQILASSRETTFRSGAMASRIAALSVVDVLFVAVAQRHYDRTLSALDATREAVSIRRY